MSLFYYAQFDTQEDYRYEKKKTFVFRYCNYSDRGADRHLGFGGIGAVKQRSMTP